MPRKRRRIVRVLLNPLVVSLVVVVVFTTGWLLYTGGSTSIAAARPGANLLPSLDSSASTEPAGGWTVGHSGDAQAALSLVDGRLNDQALKLDITRYVSGDVTLTSPRVDVEPGATYLFKAFTTTDADFTLLARKHHADGSTTLDQLPNQLERPGNAPFTVSDAFDSVETTTAVEYVFRFASEGTVRIEGAYLEAADDVQPPPTVATAPNLVPNPGLAAPESGIPDSWSPYTAGVSTVESGRTEDERGGYLWTRIANYQSGEAKWQYRPVPVTADGYFAFDATYQSEREVDVVAEFELANGERAFNNLATVPPAGEWTTIHSAFQVPDGAKTAMVTLVSHGDGTTGIRDLSVTDVTKPGPLRWDQPMVSITFDDGWQSVYDHALPLLAQHGFLSTQYVNASSIETPNFMNAAEVQQLHEAGHEIASHSYDHVDLTSIGTDRLDDEMRKGEAALAAADLGTDSFAPPFGRSDPQVDWYARKYFDTVRGTRGGINTRQSLDPGDLLVFYVTDETTPDSLAAALAETSRMHGWLILVYHQIATAPATGTQEDTIAGDRSTITEDALAAQLQLIEDSGIEVQPVTQAFARLRLP
ncbi:polysaccharide deacetylase family protein [Cryobacterium sp. PH29-G1]|uniref:polysaccharide deacetylase family protein n=1 Tax=Cryobacterium sp. PH29-G1 TaxID=3046211 RepID=UPI0024BAC583|nr:polysaccharide deacetylase family protein [Cryobacterium sp. PH29-G1]MDJ0349419.1 polysaccharide deacetylase family protein [Cryobacterium sp. PH29-G1]